MRATPTPRLFALIGATALLHACAPLSPSASAPTALQVCGDKTGHRVEDWQCRGAAADNPYIWYSFDAGVPSPPIGSALVGGSPIATNGIIYGPAPQGDSAKAKAVVTAQENPPDETIISRDASGAFVVDGAINGHPITFVVDTGATEVALSPADAASLGVDTSSLTYDRRYQTANGIGRAASFQTQEITIGSIRVSDVKAAINETPMRYSLLGQSFLDRLSSFRVERGRLYLR